MNLSMIAAALCLAPLLQSWGYDPVLALAWGVFVAGILQLGFQLPSLARLGLLPRPRWGVAHAGVRRIMKLMVPTQIGRAHVRTPVTNAHLVCRLLLEKKN